MRRSLSCAYSIDRCLIPILGNNVHVHRHSNYVWTRCGRKLHNTNFITSLSVKATSWPALTPTMLFLPAKPQQCIKKQRTVTMLKCNCIWPWPKSVTVNRAGSLHELQLPFCVPSPSTIIANFTLWYRITHIHARTHAHPDRTCDFFNLVAKKLVTCLDTHRIAYLYEVHVDNLGPQLLLFRHLLAATSEHTSELHCPTHF